MAVVVAAAVAVLLAACSQENGSAAPPAAPPAVVSVITAVPESLPVINDLPGRIAPTRIAEVRPRVSGIVVERVFEQGGLVREGDILYRIDPAPFEVGVASSRATLERARAAQLLARQQADRQKALKERNIATDQQLDAALAQLAQADADVAAAEAGLAQAELNLAYTVVRAPISGRIGRAMITEGALVTANSPESLAIIQQLDPVYADFTQSANELLQLRRALKIGRLSNADDTPVQLRFDDGTPYAHPGRLLFSEASVDENTGQVRLRGEFPNPDGELLPGMYVRVHIEQGIEHDVIAVPQQAVQRDPSGNALIHVVGPENRVEFRVVRLGRAIGDRFSVLEGIASGDRIIVEGLQKIAPGAEVAPVDWEKPEKTQVSHAG